MTPVLPIAEMFEQLRAEVREARLSALLEEARAWAGRQAAIDVAAAPESPDFPASWPLRITLDDVLRWRDADFVHACYQAILRRPPDPAGFASYLGEVRSGRSRIEIAVGFVKSPEGRAAGVQVAGADAAALRLALGRIPVLGYLLRLAKGLLMLPRQVRERETVEANLLARLSRVADEGRRLRLETAWLHERQARNLGARLARLADQSQAVLDRLPAVESALSQVRAADVAELLQASAAAKADLTVATAGLRAEIKSARAGIEKATREVHETARRVDTQEGRFAAFDARLLASHEATGQFRADLSALDARLLASHEAIGQFRADLSALDARVLAVQEAANAARSGLSAEESREALARIEAAQKDMALFHETQRTVERLDASVKDIGERLGREVAHGVAQDVQMQAVREAGVAELAHLDARLSELVTREDELLERRVGERLAALASIELDVAALRAALATFRKAAK